MNNEYIKEQFVTYEIALKLKELGFDKDCFASICTSHPNELIPYRGYPIEGNEDTHFSTINNLTVSNMWIAVPLWQQVIDWFREKYKINCVVGYTDDDKEEFMAIIDRPNQDIDYNMNPTESYYEAREQTILKAIELCQNKK